jgi:antitoxin (DNA-binding transcriptional repressor) of toxin-antitoxin stability system
MLYNIMYNMADSYSVAETREQLARLVGEVERGAEIEITRYGKTVAVLLAPAALQALRDERAAGFVEAYDRFVRTAELSRHGVDRDLFAATRDRSTFRAGR